MKDGILTHERGKLRPQPRAHVINRPDLLRPAPRASTKHPAQKAPASAKKAPVASKKPVATQAVPSIDKARKEQLLRQVSKIAAKQAKKEQLRRKTSKLAAMQAEKKQLSHQVSKKAVEKTKKSQIHKKLKVSHVAYSLAAIMLILTGYATIDTLTTNKQIRGELTTALDEGTESTNDEQSTHQAREGKDESKPDQAVLSAYTVAPDNPRMLHIDKINVNARVLPMGTNPDNSVQAPVNVFDAGWYTDSVKPGDIGAVFINAHASGRTRLGLFAYLDKLVKGDEIKLEKGDGTFLNYKVVHTETVDLKKVDMRKVLLPYGNTLRGLNLMTCSGDWVQDSQTYDKRTIVYTEQV